MRVGTSTAALASSKPLVSTIRKAPSLRLTADRQGCDVAIDVNKLDAARDFVDRARGDGYRIVVVPQG